MARPGRKPKPIHLRLLEGNRRQHKINTREPKPEGDLFEAPDFLTEGQKEKWTYAIANSPRGLLKRLDKEALTTYVVACDLYQQAVIALNASGLLIKSPVKGDPMQNPYLAIVNKQAALMLKSQAELGFTPSSRSKITVDPVGGGSEDSFDDF